MALHVRTIKTKIASVGNIKKITKAMEMVAVSKMKKAVTGALATREYATLALDLLKNIAHERNVRHSLLEQGRGDKTLMVIIASNKGLCGGFNVGLTKAIIHHMGVAGASFYSAFITIGRNAEILARKLRGDVRGSFLTLPDAPGVEDVGGIFKLVLDEFYSGAYRNVVIAHNNYISAIAYNPIVREILPVRPDIVRNMLEDIGKDEETKGVSGGDRSLYLFEPTEEEVLNEILPRLIELQLYQGLLESIASEQSARMVAMKNATDNATKMVDDLTLKYNHARQDSITQEISEIAAGANALT